MLIRVERSGGFAGLTTHAEVDSSQLSAKQAHELQQMLAAAQPFAQKSRDSGAMPDQYQYDITVKDGGREQTFTTNDAAASEELQSLIDWVMKAARNR